MEWTGLDKLLLYEAAQQAGTKEARSVEREATPDSCRAASHRAVPGNDESGRPTSDLRPPTSALLRSAFLGTRYAALVRGWGMLGYATAYCILYTVHCIIVLYLQYCMYYHSVQAPSTVTSLSTVQRPQAPASITSTTSRHPQALYAVHRSTEAVLVRLCCLDTL